ncbi:MAG: type II toxin-antitoxin system prevent-host-death family antitoxin [Spirochaetaceae bacterium]|nr:type II toxin-antitoxin system prevent-host-death family antitoxin [Spirochaetaceae bacterium]
MQRIEIRDLHLKTGEWVRRAALGDGVVITDRGRPLASLIPARPDDLSTPFSRRRTLPEFDALPVVPGEAARHVSEDRDRG